MSFQDTVNNIFGPTLYNNYNKAISEVIGSKLENKDDKKIKEVKVKEDNIRE